MADALPSQPIASELKAILAQCKICVSTKNVMFIEAPTNAAANVINAALTTKGICHFHIHDKQLTVAAGPKHLAKRLIDSGVTVKNVERLGPLQGTAKGI